jgi:hypothetical protein
MKCETVNPEVIDLTHTAFPNPARYKFDTKQSTGSVCVYSVFVLGSGLATG